MVSTKILTIDFFFCLHFVACEVIKDIQWSQQLDSIFIDNYQKDPTLSFQFFGSSTGFMRQFPGMWAFFDEILSRQWER